MNRKIYYWKLRTAELQLGDRTLVMGVLNVTPDSFSDGGNFLDPDRACARALEMEEEGADIIDIGAESTRPDSKRISADEEWQRLVPVLKRLRDRLTVPLSLDTYKSEIAERALEYGVQILNDPSGLTFDAGLAKVAANGNAGLILNHMRGTPETWGALPPLPDVTGSVLRDLDATTSRARRAGVEKNRIVIDPGLGFGKRKEQNSEILAQLGRLAELDYPILAAPSRKSFLAHAGDGGETLFATAAAVTAAILNGAHIVRVHDIKEMRAVVLMADEIRRLSTVAAKVDGSDEENSAVRARPRSPKLLPAYMGEEKRPPMRPPVMKPAPPAAQVHELPGEKIPDATAEPLQMPAMQIPAMETPSPAQPPSEPIAAASAKMTPGEKPAIPRRPPQDKPSKGWEPARPPARSATDRPAKEYRPGGDRAPRTPFGERGSRPPLGDRVPRRNPAERPAAKPFGDRPPRKDSGDRPTRPSFGDREPRNGDRPARAPFGDRPPRKDFRDRPARPAFGDRGPRKDSGTGDRPARAPFGDRPPRKDTGDRPARPPFGSAPPRGTSGDRPFRKGPNDGPPRGPSGGKPPKGRPPQRPFRKRP